MSKKDSRLKNEKINLSDLIISILKEKKNHSLNLQQLVNKLALSKKFNSQKLLALLNTLQQENKIERTPNGHYKLKPTPKAHVLTGVVDHVTPRFAYVTIDENGVEDVYVQTPDLKKAIHGDLVSLSIFQESHSSKPKGKVIEIIKRGRNRFVGRLELGKKVGFIVPDSKKIYSDFLVYPENVNGANTNDKVLFEVTKWAEGDKCAEAKIIELLGKTGENNAEIHSIMAEFDLPFRFPENVLRESEEISETITTEDIKKRKDYRSVHTFTIDPENAKDFDDAISFQILPNQNFEIGVHIADVTHYVKPKNKLDNDAYNRATSVYLVDRTVPMLPERLSNVLCSLRPHEDKLTFAVIFEIDATGKIHRKWFGRTIICSNHRFTYEQAQDVIETKKGIFAEELQILNQLHKKLRAKRLKKGAVNFETTEVNFKLDELGKPLAVVPKIRKEAHKLIEEFMLLANQAVATYIYKIKKGEEKNTFVYRTHDFPDSEKVADFALFAKQFGHTLQIEEKVVSQSLNKLMTTIEGKPEQNVLQSLAVRAMAKAKYTTDEKPHFGLAFEHYTHFTSPIRRYPDMIVHRLLQHYLDGGKSVNKKEVEEMCIHCSEREKRAAEAERASIKYKQVEFMSMAEKKPFAGIITGVTDFGLFVEIIETKCEGMVRLSDIKDDFYEFDEKKYRAIGRRRKKIYRLGDQVVVQIKKIDVDRRIIDLVFE